MSEKSSEVQAQLKDKLLNSENVCLTIDIWSSRHMRGFLGITAHFIVGWTLHSQMLCCKRFKGKYTAENIRQHYEEILDQFGISEKINFVLTDNASNMIKAFATPCQDSKVKMTVKVTKMRMKT